MVASQEDKLLKALENAELPNQVKKCDPKETTSKNSSADVETLESNCPEFYMKAQKYWAEVPATVNGMLGGLGYISAIDIQGSSLFLRQLKALGNKNALDCGAGIGRVTKNLLIPRFATVDMVEQDEKFSKKALDYCTNCDENTLNISKRLGTIYNVGLQKFSPEVGKYDLIWSQWVLDHMTDEDLLALFRRLRTGLTKNGYLVLKENVTSSKKMELDEVSSSVTRPLKTYERVLRDAGFRIIKTTLQQNFPKGLYPVYTLACRPVANGT